MKKMINHVFAIMFLALGLLFMVVPGPSLIFFIAGLLLLAFYYPWARRYLSHFQKALKSSCQFIDKKLARR
ncbi:putative transmembrane protein (PGPGW) [Pseudoalteromonas sp. P1-9]|uniref:PGPGW domain-containing protein n=1 Tax=Pseudoalteromonas sp. P1-9 TaxID=1710354 RepID=UPI0006D6236F|nr:PGPGW domain-containing protein [Pseudoalteromonas sp. P1-9]KPV95641.1 putative transmembrane protein (PGPGW) [Pseudoalteromonas sp. P1-9]